MGVPRYANGKLCEVMVGMISKRTRERERQQAVGKEESSSSSSSFFQRGHSWRKSFKKHLLLQLCTVAQLQLLLGIA